ncbi:MAG TPA: hypothetical protein VFP84_07825 [Kofleriaceae bacterium]|nr:hypothetical protein [Kofleriaceae bacterium]
MTMPAAHPLARSLGEIPVPPLLDTAGAQVILGGEPGVITEPGPPTAHTLFGPRGAAMLAPDGPLVVADTGHHRLLIWKFRPRYDREPADLVIGQPDFVHGARNAGGEVGAATLNAPSGVAIGAGVIAVADAWNHRVLIWRDMPTRANQPADLVLGQLDHRGHLANRGLETPRADTLHACAGVAICNGRLFVADTGNRRVLVWDSIPTRDGAPADLVLGQRGFGAAVGDPGDAVASAPGASAMRWPHAMTMWLGDLLVSDAGFHRVMGWRSFPRENGQPCDYVLGQATSTEVDPVRGTSYPSAATLSMPYGIAVIGDRLAVSDTACSRLIGYARYARSTNALARWLSGQRRFCDKGDNRWELAARDSVCWPYAISACNDTAVIADSGNNRVLLWDAA